MPINPKLKEQLTKQIKDESYRDKLIATLEDAPPEVQNNWMSQEDYTRQVNAFKEEQKTWKVKADEFYDKSNTSIEAWKTERQKALDAVDAAKARIAELEGGGTPPKTGAEEDATMKEIKGLKDLVGQLSGKLEKVVTQDHLDGAYKDAVGFMGEQSIKLRQIERDHLKTFGNEFTEKDTLDLLEYANKLSTDEGKRIPLDKAYKAKYEADIQKKWEETKMKELEEKFNSTHRIPTGEGGTGGSGGGAGPDKGPLQIRLEQLQKGDTAGAYKTWQEAAAAGAEELVKEGKF